MANWDVVVIGGGASGLSAAAATAAAGLSCLVIDRMAGGGELGNLGTLHDFAEPLTGPELAARLLDEAITAGAELGVAEVTGLNQLDTGWRVVTDDDTHTARAVVLAVGLAHGTLGIDGEADFEGMGLSHCAACDGPLFRGEPVIVAGSDRWAVQDAHDLAAIASEVTLVTQGGAAEGSIVTPGDAGPLPNSFTVIAGHVIALEGTSGLETVLIEPAGGGAPRRVAAQVVFVQSGRRAAMEFVPEVMARDQNGLAVTSAGLACDQVGLFAVGDARAGAIRTLANAMEDGRRVAASIQAALRA